MCALCSKKVYNSENHASPERFLPFWKRLSQVIILTLAQVKLKYLSYLYNDYWLFYINTVLTFLLYNKHCAMSFHL